MSYTSVFGGTTIYPSDVSYLALALDADAQLEWPLENSTTDNPAARVIDITASGAYNIDLPDATQTGAGQTILFNNLSASSSTCYVRDNAGTIIATLAVGEQWQVYLAGTATAAGTWRVFRYGASTATVQASALAGYGLAVTTNTLSQSMPVTTFAVTPRTLLETDRASTLVWTGAGNATVSLPAVATTGNNFFFAARNAGGGDLTLDPSGSELIDDASTLVLRPGDSATFVTDGLTWYSVGLGQDAVFAFDYTSIDITGETSPYTLSGSELNRIAYKFIGTLTANMEIIVPPTIQQYWVDNQTTGSFTLGLKTSSGSVTTVNQGSRGIYYCDGVNFVNASTAGISVPLNPADGGTGQTSYTVGDLLYASGATTLSRLADVAVGNALVSGGVGVAASWGKIGLTTHVSGVLPVANGGTALSATPTNGQLAIGNGTNYTLAALTAGTGISVTNGAGSITVTNTAPDQTVAFTNGTGISVTGTYPNFTISATGGSGTVTSIDVSGGTTGLTFTGGPVTTSGTITTSGTLAVANGGTGATTAAAARSALSAAASGANTDITALDQDITVTATGTIAANTIGYRGLPANTKTGAYTLVLADAGKIIPNTTGGWAVPANGTTAFPVGTTIVLYNDSASSQNVTITTDTLRLAGTATTGTRAVALRGLATLVKVASTEWIISGAGVS